MFRLQVIEWKFCNSTAALRWLICRPATDQDIQSQCVTTIEHGALSTCVPYLFCHSWKRTLFASDRLLMRSASGALHGVGGIAVSIATFWGASAAWPAAAW